MAGVFEVSDLLFGLLFFDSVSLLKDSDQLISFSCHPRDVVVSKISPFLLNLALELVPVSLDLIPIHIVFLAKACDAGAACEHRS